MLDEISWDNEIYHCNVFQIISKWITIFMWNKKHQYAVAFGKLIKLRFNIFIIIWRHKKQDGRQRQPFWIKKKT